MLLGSLHGDASHHTCHTVEARAWPLPAGVPCINQVPCTAAPCEAVLAVPLVAALCGAGGHAATTTAAGSYHSLMGDPESRTLASLSLEILRLRGDTTASWLFKFWSPHHHPARSRPALSPVRLEFGSARTVHLPCASAWRVVDHGFYTCSGTLLGGDTGEIIGGFSANPAPVAVFSIAGVTKNAVVNRIVAAE
ncbi:unnamed protein product [Closterium sp. Yama58-4]|nr:unnamed protein product [Closterium sp. Yama58-4]